MGLQLSANIEIDDLIQAGMIGLLNALNRYREVPGAKFETYAIYRIRGAMVDEIRKGDWLPRLARKNVQQIAAATKELQQRLARTPLDSEIARELGVSMRTCRKMLIDVYQEQVTYYDEESMSQAVVVTDSYLSEAVKNLMPREKELIDMYYEQELNFRQIGAILGIHESRVCQIHSEVIALLREKMKNYRGNKP